MAIYPICVCIAISVKNVLLIVVNLNYTLTCISQHSVKFDRDQGTNMLHSLKKKHVPHFLLYPYIGTLTLSMTFFMNVSVTLKFESDPCRLKQNKRMRASIHPKTRIDITSLQKVNRTALLT